MPEENKPQDTTAQPAAGERKPDTGKGPVRRKHGRSVAFAIAHINCSFNNTIVTIADDKGNTLAWCTAGACGFKGTKKGTPFAAQITAGKAAQKAAESGVREIAILVSGPGPGRETAIRSLQTAGLHVISIKDVTPIPHNGCRPPKARRV